MSPFSKSWQSSKSSKDEAVAQLRLCRREHEFFQMTMICCGDMAIGYVRAGGIQRGFPYWERQQLYAPMSEITRSIVNMIINFSDKYKARDIGVSVLEEAVKLSKHVGCCQVLAQELSVFSE